MNQLQYSRLRQNQWRYAPQALLTDGSDRGLLRAASRQLKQRERVERLIGELVPLEWSRVIRVEAVAKGTVTLSSSDMAVMEGLRRQTDKLSKQLARLAPGVNRLRVALAGESGD